MYPIRGLFASGFTISPVNAIVSNVHRYICGCASAHRGSTQQLTYPMEAQNSVMSGTSHAMFSALP